jgi:hypothetical protein
LYCLYELKLPVGEAVLYAYVAEDAPDSVPQGGYLLDAWYQIYVASYKNKVCRLIIKNTILNNLWEKKFPPVSHSKFKTFI